MTSWWTKLGDILRPPQREVVEDSVAASPALAPEPPPAEMPAEVPAPALEPPPPAGPRSPEPTEAAAELIQAPVPPAASATDALVAVDARLASLAAATTRIADALRRLHDGNQETLEIVRQLSSLLAGFPELSADAARLLGDVEERLDSIERRTADGADILGRAARDAAEAKENTAGVKQSQEQCRRACEELLQEQGQIAEVFSGLRELTSRSVDLARASAAAIKTIADERAERVDDLREHVSEECRRVATRATVASLLAALGAVAAATAAVISALHQP